MDDERKYNHITPKLILNNFSFKQNNGSCIVYLYDKVIKKDFEKVVLRKLFSGLKNKSNLERHLKSLWEKQLLGLDDYTIAIMGDQK